MQRLLVSIPNSLKSGLKGRFQRVYSRFLSVRNVVLTTSRLDQPPVEDLPSTQDEPRGYAETALEYGKFTLLIRLEHPLEGGLPAISRYVADTTVELTLDGVGHGTGNA